MSSSAINQGVLSAKISNVQNVGDSSAVCSTTGDWSFKNATATATNVFISNAGNVGIGTTSPINQTAGRANLTLNGTSSSILYLGVGGVSRGYFYSDLTHSELDSPGYLQFNTNGAERIRIDASGNLLVGTTSVGYIGSEALTLSRNSGTTKWSVGPYTTQPGQFYVASAAGTGVYLTSTAATSWTSNSDERLKTNLQPIQNAIEKINELRAFTGRYKTDDEHLSRTFLIAQDVQRVLPEAVSATKIPGMGDDVDYLGLAYTDVIPLLVAGIKELSAKVEEQSLRLEAQAAEIAALKAS